MKLYPFKAEDPTSLPVDASVVVELGHLVKIVGGFVVPVAASTDNLVLYGVALEAHSATDPAGLLTVAMAVPGDTFEMPLDAATDIVAGDLLAINNSGSLTKSATDAIAVAVESKLGATSIRFKFKLPLGFIGDLS